jgi:hypothetical protein
MSERTMWDFSDLTGDTTPVALDDFFPEDSEDLFPNQLEEMRATPVGATYSVDLGAGGTRTYTRVS